MLRNCPCCARANRPAKSRKQKRRNNSNEQPSQKQTGGADKLRLYFLLYALRMRTSLPAADQKLVQIVDAALAQTARKSGDWLACRKGCTQCCFGPFPISQLDAVRLRKGLAD